MVFLKLSIRFKDTAKPLNQHNEKGVSIVGIKRKEWIGKYIEK
jgi:hypothetical protein